MNQYLAAAKRRQANGEPLDDNDKSLLGLLHADPLHDCVEVSAEELGALQRQAKPTNGAARRPTIQITTDIHDNVDEAAKLLARDPEVYQRDGQLVRVVRIAESEADTTQHAGTPVVRPIVAATLRERLTLAADWVKLDKRTKKWLPTVPTDPIVGALAARGAWDRVRPIVGITEAPLFRPNGTILETPGYDANTGYLYVPSGGFPKVPAKPTQVDARRA
ncbi:MAG TPA: hypothetical protein PKA88_13595, partial [Polyangiaceae bacterium]|nr:hypothetical protein [Polyangiaceae bacterium]